MRSTFLATLFSLVAALMLYPLAVAASSLPDFATLVEQQAPAVVNISARQSAQPRLPSIPGLDENDPMFDLFRRFIPGLPDRPGLDPDGRSLGSGFIIDADGYILTNAHVIEGADEVMVRLADRREFVATVVGADARSDVALIRIEASDLPSVELGDPNTLKVGQWVVAIGSPFGFDQSVTAGIVSAKGRSLPDENFVPFIQTDVAINPGNSGGPLFNLRGEVVGINSQIYSQTGGFMGLSFAIPIDVAMRVQAQLREGGRVERGRIGVAVQEVTRALAESFGLARAEGALVSAVEPGGPAASAGVETGDVIVRFDGQHVVTSSELPRIVAAGRPGSEVSMEVVRAGERKEIRIKLGQWDDEPGPGVLERVRPAPTATQQPNRLGLVLENPEASSRDAGRTPGLIVRRVESVAATADLRPGDRVLALVTDGRQLRPGSVEEFERVLEGVAEGQVVTLLVGRGNSTSYVSIRAEGK